MNTNAGGDAVTRSLIDRIKLASFEIEIDFNGKGSKQRLIDLDKAIDIIRQHCAHGLYTGNGEQCPQCYENSGIQGEICDDNYMTVVFDRSVVSFDKNPMHIKSEFGNVVAISRGDALAKLDATREPVSRKEKDDAYNAGYLKGLSDGRAENVD